MDVWRVTAKTLSLRLRSTITMPSFLFRDYQLVVFGDARRVVAASRVQKNGDASAWTRPPLASKIAGVLDAVGCTPEANLIS